MVVQELRRLAAIRCLTNGDSVTSPLTDTIRKYDESRAWFYPIAKENVSVPWADGIKIIASYPGSGRIHKANISCRPAIIFSKARSKWIKVDLDVVDNARRDVVNV